MPPYCEKHEQFYEAEVLQPGGLFASNRMVCLACEAEAEVIERDPVTVFLNRWCHRALGDRAMAEKELRELIASPVRESRDV